MRRAALAVALALLAACGDAGEKDGAPPADEAVVTVESKQHGETHRFRVEIARTPERQSQGLKYRTALAPDGGMLFAPLTPDGAARPATFWMRDTAIPLDILFIRADGTIARIAENTVPFSEAPVPSDEPVTAVLEIAGGRAAQAGIAEGDTVRWTGG